MPRFKVVITDFDYGDNDVERAILEPIGAEVVALQARSEDDLLPAAADCDAIMNQYARVGARTIAAMTRCRVIARYGVVVDIVDVDAATERGILVTNVRDYCTEEVADHAIALALTGAGPVALALAFVASTAVFALSCARATGWSFVTWPRLRGSRAILRFTSTVFAITALGQVTQALPALVLARLVDMATLGFFSRSADLVTRANRAITEVAGNVVAPHVYRQTRAGEDPAQGFMNALARMTVAIWPAALLMSALAGPIVRLLLGPQWDAAIPVLQWLSLGLVLAPLRFLAGTYAMALGFERRVLLRAAVFVVVTGAALYALAGLGLTAVVLGLLAVQAAELLSTLAILWRRAGLRTGPVLVEMARSLAVTLAAVLPAWAIGLALPEGTGSDLTRIALGLAVAAALWLAALALVRHPIQDELPVSVPKLLRGVRRRAGR